MSQNKTTSSQGQNAQSTPGQNSPTGGNLNLTPSNTPNRTTGSQGTSTATATALAQEYGQKIADAAGTAKEFVSEKVSVVGDKLKDLQNTDFNEVVTQAKDYARKNPAQTILISAAAGFVIGLLLRGSRR